VLLNPARWRLKSKVISILLFILLIPLTSIFLLKAIEESLVDKLEENILLSAKLYALQLSNNNEWFSESKLPDDQAQLAKELFVFPLQQSILLDGFFEEWEFIEKFRQDFKALDASHDPESMGLLLGAEGSHLYLSLRIIDKRIIYPAANDNFRSDQIVISFLDNEKIPQRVFVTPRAPGKIPVKKVDNNQLKIDWRYTAHWIETATGFNLEIKFPSGMKPTRLQVRFYDVDLTEQSTHQKIIASSLLDLNAIVWPSNKLSRYVSQLQVIPGQRVWILDTEGRVMARQGDLQVSVNDGQNTNPIVNWLFGLQREEVVDTRAERLRLSSPIIADALAKKPATTIETSRRSDFALALAASPIVTGEKVIGAVLIEENVARVQLMQKRTMSQLLYVMAAIIVVVMLLVGGYISRLVARISSLRKQVSSLVDEQGRMTAPFELNEKQGDEIDELYTAFQQMGNKLYEYHDYLEKLASRLSHELRTPIAIVRSSLDNLLLNHQDAQDIQTIQRALDGTLRLGEIISRMRQASGVKEAMQTASFESLEMNQFIGQLVEGFSHSFSAHQFKFEPLDKPLSQSIAPDLFAELMDKLLTNAMDFTEEGAPIVVSLKQEKQAIVLSVSNRGPLILKKNLKKIFQSLVSIREKKTSNAPNLGLGLYVVKLISEFHGAKATAENLTDGSGVVFKVVWKVSKGSKF
jgi:two-component system, OmpR family, sensor histidine kinase ChvG